MLRAVPSPKVIYESDSCSIGACPGLLVQRWFAGVKLEDARATLTAHNIAMEGRECVLVLVGVDGIPRLPESDARSQLGELAKTTADQVTAHATIISADGFGGSALRSVLTAIFAFSGAKYPKKVFGNVGDASDWLATFSDEYSSQALVQAFSVLPAPGTG